MTQEKNIFVPVNVMARRLMASMIVLAVVVNGLLALFLYRTHGEARQQVAEQMGSVNNAIANELGTHISLIDLSLQAASRVLYRGDRWANPRDVRDVRDTRAALAATARTLPGFQRGDTVIRPGSLIVTDADGTIVLDSKASPPRAGNAAKNDFFIVQKQKPNIAPIQTSASAPSGDADDSDASGAPYISKVVKSPLDGLYYLCISRRLSTPDGKFAGIIFGTIPIHMLEERLAGLKLGMAGTATLVKEDGTVLLRRPMDPQLINASLQNTPLFPAVAQHASGSFETQSVLDHVERLFVYSQVPGTRLIMTQGRALTDVYAMWRERARVLILIDVLLTLCILALAWMFRREFRHRQLGHLATIRNESLFRGALDGSSVGTALFELDRHVSYANPALARFLARPIDTLLGDKLHDFLGAAHWNEDDAGLRDLEARSLDAYMVERQFTLADGSHVFGLVSVALVRSSKGSPRFFIAQVQDITKRREAEQQLSLQNERLQITFASIADGVVTTDEEGRVRFVNPAAEAISGWSNADAAGLPIGSIFSLRDPDTGLPVKDAVRRALSAPRATPVSITGVLVDRHGWRREVACNASAVRDADDEVLGTVLVLRDVSESRELHRKLAYNASHDALTGLPNRTAFGDALEVALLEVQSSSRQHALAFVDLDRFKIVNDTAGHRAGDVLLKQIALLVPAQLRSADVVGRLGGDELGVILRDCPIDDAKGLMERLTAAINALQFEWEGHVYNVGASIGLTVIDAKSVSPNAVLTEADVACYAAKNNGRNMVSVYSADQSEAADWHRKIVLAAGIREAIEEGRIFLYAQKVLPNAKDEPARWELLSRMFDRDGAPIPTSVFIPAAERYDLMGLVDRWGLQHALTELRRALDLGLLFPVHINLSANSLNDPDFVPDALKLIADSGVPGSALTFEITETALMRNLASATVAINALRASGIQIALDDFGIGLSSFGYLRNFPVDIVKIDGGFVVNMTENSVDRNIVKSIHQITRDLGARTVAESVENDDTLKMLQQMGVDFFQGYGIHRPQPLRPTIDEEIARVCATAHSPSGAEIAN